MTRSEVEATFVRLMLAASRLWRTEADRSLAAHQVSSAHGWALVQVARLGDEVRQVDLARALGVSAPSVVRLIDRLVGEGLLERRRDPDDRRAQRLVLTGRGRAVAAESDRLLLLRRSDLLADVSDADLAIAVAVAAKIQARAARERRA